MLYKRHEYFRHSFGTPLDATFRILVGDGANASNPGKCVLLDVSPGGSKIATDFDLPLDNEPVTLQLNFTLFEIPVNLEGKIAWKKRAPNNFHYGIKFAEDPSIAKLIVDELKLRRRTETKPTEGSGK